jgi:phosphate butyryltransferase
MEITVSNKLFDEIKVGDRVAMDRVCTEHDLYVFASITGNFNPLHLPGEPSVVSGENKGGAVAPSMWFAALVANLLGTSLPGPGTLYRSQSLNFHARVGVGDEVTVSVEVVDKREPQLIILETRVVKSSGDLVADGFAEVFAPLRKLTDIHLEAPGVMLRKHRHCERLVAACAGLRPIAMAVICPEEPQSLGGALRAHAAGLIEPILIGNRRRIDAAAATLGADLSQFQRVDADSDFAASATAVRMARDGTVAALMKGHLHSDVMLAEVMRRDGGLRSGRRISHVFVMDTPGLEHPLFISDAAINIAPDLAAKADITQNAINLARACGIAVPKVGILSAIETVNPAIPSTIDAAVLAKMAERGQIVGGIVDGPLAMDNAVNLEAARSKGIQSLVAGHAQVLIVPNMEAGNMLAKELTFVASALAAGLVLGASVPIILTSRADDAQSRLMSCALAHLYVHWTKTGVSAVRGPVAPAEIHHQDGSGR